MKTNEEREITLTKIQIYLEIIWKLNSLTGTAQLGPNVRDKSDELIEQTLDLLSKEVWAF